MSASAPSTPLGKYSVPPEFVELEAEIMGPDATAAMRRKVYGAQAGDPVPVAAARPAPPSVPPPPPLPPTPPPAVPVSTPTQYASSIGAADAPAAGKKEVLSVSSLVISEKVCLFY